jgi:hypothetical protein
MSWSAYNHVMEWPGSGSHLFVTLAALAALAALMVFAAREGRR